MPVDVVKEKLLTWVGTTRRAPPMLKLQHQLLQLLKSQRLKLRRRRKKNQRNKYNLKLPVLKRASLVLCMFFVWSLTMHIFLGISSLTNLGVPFAGALKDHSKLGGTVVGMLLVATAVTAKRSHANCKEKAS